MYKFKIGDWVKVVYPVNFWNGRVEKKNVGKIFQITGIVNGLYTNANKEVWGNYCLELAEMDNDLWSKMSPEEKLKHNALALKALAEGQNIEELYHGKWIDSMVLEMKNPYRPKKIPTTRPDTVIKWKSFKEEEPSHGKKCYILHQSMLLETPIVYYTVYNGYCAFNLDDGQIVTSK